MPTMLSDPEDAALDRLQSLREVVLDIGPYKARRLATPYAIKGCGSLQRILGLEGTGRNRSSCREQVTPDH